MVWGSETASVLCKVSNRVPVHVVYLAGWRDNLSIIENCRLHCYHCSFSEENVFPLPDHSESRVNHRNVHAYLCFIPMRASTSGVLNNYPHQVGTFLVLM